MLKTTLIMNGAYQLPLPVNEGLAVLNSIIEIQKSVTSTNAAVEILDEELFQHNIKS